MSDFHKQWKNYVSLVEQAPPVGPRGPRPRAKSPVRVPVGYDSTKPTSRKTRKLERGVTITFPDPDGPQSGSGKRMVTRTLYRVPGARDSGVDWKSWDPNDKDQETRAKRDLMIHAKTLEGRLNNPEFMKMMRETHPDASQDFAGFQNMMIDRPYEFELRLDAIQATKDAGPFKPHLPPGSVEKELSTTNAAPDLASMETSRKGAVEFGKKYDIPEQELQAIWDEEEAKLKTAYDNKDLDHAGAIKVHGEYYDNQGNVNQKARQYLTNKIAKEFQKRMMKKSHPKWTEEEIVALVDTGEAPEHPTHLKQLAAINKRLESGETPDIIEWDELFGTDAPTSVASYWAERAKEVATGVPEEERKFTDDILHFTNEPELYYQILAGEDAKHGFPGVPGTIRDAVHDAHSYGSNMASRIPYVGSKGQLTDDDPAELRRKAALGLPLPAGSIPAAKNPLLYGTLPALGAAAALPFVIPAAASAAAAALPAGSSAAKVALARSAAALGTGVKGVLPAGTAASLLAPEVLRDEAEVFGGRPYWVNDRMYIPPPAAGEDFQALDDEEGLRAVDKSKKEYAEQNPAAAPAAEAARASAAEDHEARRKAAVAASSQERSKTYRDYVPPALRFEALDHASNELIVGHIKRAIMKEYYQGSEVRAGARMPINLFKQDRHITYDSDPFDVFSYEFEQAFNSLVAKYNFAIEDEHLQEPVFHEAGRVIQSFVDVDSIERDVPPQVYDENTTLDTIMSEFQNLFAELVATHSAEIEEENLGDDVYREAIGLVKARLGLV